MRGLTDLERECLEDAAKDVGADTFSAEMTMTPEQLEVSLRLERRGLIREYTVENEDSIIWVDAITPLGRLALECDRAARMGSP
jgi:hypothetical protein